MSNASHPRTPVPAVKKPPRAPWWPREWPARIFLGFAFVVCVPFLVEYTFRPLRSEHFLRLAANEEAYGPYAVLVGIGFAAGFGWLVWKAPTFAHNEGRFDATSGQVGFAFFLIAAPLMGFWVGWTIVTLWVPLLQHQFAAKKDVAVPFEITGFVSDDFCWGVRAVHPSFYDDKLCGVDLSGPSAERRGSTILVFGRQSPYGLTIDQYRAEPRGDAPPPAPAMPSASTAADRAEIQKAFERCVEAPAATPKPFHAVFRIVVEAKGEIRSMRVVSFGPALTPAPAVPAPTPAHATAAEAIASHVMACSSLRGVPAGIYTLPVVVGR